MGGWRRERGEVGGWVGGLGGGAGVRRASSCFFGKRGEGAGERRGGGEEGVNSWGDLDGWDICWCDVQHVCCYL